MNLLVGLVLCSTAAFAQTKIETAADKVTVFLNGAQVERNKDLELPAGQSTLVFTGLSPYMDVQSVQVNAKGKLTVLAVNHQYNYVDEAEAGERRQKLQSELKALEKQLKEQDAMLSVIESQYELLKTNCSAKESDLDKIKELNKYYTAQVRALKTEEMKIAEEREAVSGRIEKLKAEITQSSGRRTDRMSEIAVTVKSPAACKSSFNLKYFVRNAGWYPSYDVRAEKLDEPVTVVYKANVFQNTGEEWKDVRLKLSSSNPTVGNVAPELGTWWLDYPARQRAAGNVLYAKSFSVAADAVAEPEMEDSMAMDVTYRQGVTSYEFEIGEPYGISSGNKAVVAEIGHYELPAVFGYRCTPKLDKDAFLVASFADWEELHLLPGEASVYFENTFVGNSVINPEISDTLTFSLGRDRQILVDRKKESDKVVRKIVGNSCTQTVGWRISVRNTRSEAVELALFDQIPVSRNSDIVVSADTLDGGSLDAATGIVTWNLKLEAGEQKDLVLRYKVRYPKNSELFVE